MAYASVKMTIRSSTRITQRLTFLLLGLFVALMLNTSAWSHSGHDHGDDQKPIVAADISDPRFAVETSLFQLVGEARGDVLTLYLDTFETNAPVAGAVVNVSVGVEDQVAEERSTGTYQISGDWVATSGQHDLIISITAGEDADLMLAEYVVPEPTVVLDKTVSAWWENYLPDRLNTYVTPALTSAANFISNANTAYLLAAIFAVGLVLGLFIRNTVFPIASSVLVLALIAAPEQTIAHSGHDHGDDDKEATVSTGNRPQRLADGSVFLPKPTQRLLQIRSTIATLSNVPLSERLLGKTLSDPAYTGVVQAVRDGLIDFPSKKLPTIGETIQAGDVVAILTPVLAPEIQVSMTEQLGALTQQIAVTEQRLARLESASRINVAGEGSGLSLSAVSKGSLEELELQLATLINRREALNAISFGSLELVASQSGTISRVGVTAGQVVSVGDTLIEIIDPNRVWVEAVAYPGQSTDFVTKARAVLPENVSLPLSFVSRSLSLTAQTQTLYFRLEEHEAVPTGTPVTVILESDILEHKLLLPRSAVVRGSSGLMIVWIQENPEIFRPQIVKAQSFDGIHMKINAGLNEGDRVVIEGASFLSQVR